jgi:glycine cleavage system H protein
MQIEIEPRKATMNVPGTLKYTKTHEWARVEKDLVVVGITDHAQHELTDIVYIDDFPGIGATVQKGKVIAVIESVKAVADVMAPVSGKLVEVNGDLEKAPEMLNKSPYTSWIAKIKPSNPGEIASLLSADAYKKEIPA